MKMHEKYLEVLKTFDDFVALKEWAEKFKAMYPDDFERIDSKAKSQKTKTTGLRELIKRISSNIINTKKWSNIVIEKQGNPSKLYRFVQNKETTNKVEDNIKNNKTVVFNVLIKALKYLPDNDNLPNRDEYSYFESSVDFVGYKEYIAFEMAIRNKHVIDISKKLDYIDKIIDKYLYSDSFRDWLRGIEHWEYKFEGDPPELTVDLDKKNEYIFIAELPITKFKQDIDFILNIEKSTKIEDIVPLKIIADYLQNKLVRDYCIYKDGYYFYKDDKYFNPNEIIDSDSIFKHDFHNYNLENNLKSAINILTNRKAEDMKQTADMFFMYDYYNSKKEANDMTFYSQDIKFALTKYHGIDIITLKKRFSYDYCLEYEKELDNKQASFYTVEKTITDKIKSMEKFIDQELYKYILFY